MYWWIQDESYLKQAQQLMHLCGPPTKFLNNVKLKCSLPPTFTVCQVNDRNVPNIGKALSTDWTLICGENGNMMMLNSSLMS